MKTTITCLGHGGAFSPLRIGNTAFLVEYEDRRILIDCGTTVPESLKEFDIDPGSLDAVIITHLHADHVGGLERLLYHRHYICKAEPVKLIMGKSTRLDWVTCVDACQNDLDSHAELLRDADPGRFGKRGQSGDLCQIWPFGYRDVEVMLFRVNHGGDIPNMSCYAVRLTMPDGSNLFFSGDRIWKHEGSDEVIAVMLKCDLAFHEIEMSVKPSGAHTHYTDITGLGDSMGSIRWAHHGMQFTDDPPHDLGGSVKLAYKGHRWEVDGGNFTRLADA